MPIEEGVRAGLREHKIFWEFRDNTSEFVVLLLEPLRDQNGRIR